MNPFFSSVNVQQSSFEDSSDVLPDNISYIAKIERIHNHQFSQGERIITSVWRVLQPAEFANRVFFEKFRVYDPDITQQNKAKQKLAAVANLLGGRLFSEMQGRQEQAPSDASLSALCEQPLAIQLRIYDFTDESGRVIKGNAIRKIEAVNAPAYPAQPPAYSQQQSYNLAVQQSYSPPSQPPF